MKAAPKEIVTACINAAFSIIENTSFSISDGLISTMVKKQDIVGVFDVLTLYLSQLSTDERTAFAPKIEELNDGLENVFLSGEVETYSKGNGQTKQGVSRLPFDKILKAKKKMEKIQEKVSVQSFTKSFYG
ncbi:MAG: hypothetical protein FWF51_06565 [Chitinivibrionia bacterium]|nr:hypothetical protein [Chitinivibrionia bacterium]